jgi:hypothetical protein
MALVTDPNDPRLKRYIGPEDPGPQSEVYLILSKEERSKGFVRPVRQSYVHKVCGGLTHMGLELSETYARNPKFYGATYCCSCCAHFPVSEFTWGRTDEVVGS